ncbi:MAG TPA: aspartate-semialdehyde dehydrogenase [Vicinamibacterales bacterium]
MAQTIEVGVLGATGTVGQQFVRLLQGHPWFRLTWVAGSERSEGKRYEDAAPWRLSTPIPEGVRDMVVQAPVPGRGPRLVFSALDASVATEIEGAFAEAGHIVVSNARNYRMDPHVPLLVPEINADHLSLVRQQASARGWKGAIVTNPNCSTVFLAMSLAPLRAFGLKSAMVTTLQAVSGAGYPGVASLDIVGNVVPFISGEEEKLESETRRILGSMNGAGVVPHAVNISAQTTRVPVLDGHTESVSVWLEQQVELEAVRQALESFAGPPQQHRLPSAPARPIIYLTEQNRPQPRLDAEREGGMAVFVGRLRSCPVATLKYIALGHNTVRGAAGAAILNAELMKAEGLL